MLRTKEELFARSVALGVLDYAPEAVTQADQDLLKNEGSDRLTGEALISLAIRVVTVVKDAPGLEAYFAEAASTTRDTLLQVERDYLNNDVALCA